MERWSRAFGVFTIAASAILFGSDAARARTSLDCFDSASGDVKLTSLADRYRRVVQSQAISQVQKNWEVSKILNDLFLPFLDGLRSGGKSETPANLAKKIEFLEVKKSLVVQNVAYVEAAGTEYEGLQLSMEQSAQEGLRLEETSSIGRSEEILFLKPSSERNRLIRQFSILPTAIGVYGNDFAMKRMITTRVLQELAIEHLSNLSKAQWKKNQVFFRN